MKIISSELYVKDNKVYHEGNKPKPKDIGAAPETHTHNYASATTPGGSAEHAIKATEDSLGQRIDTYIKGLSVSGRTITYTRGDGTTGTITTQDNNTDTKVTNTLNTTAKAYITGTTDSATNTGTQVFDTNVYLDTTAGMLTATTFKGALQGNAATATSATSATSATKLATARTINGTSFDGTGNITTANWGAARNIQIGNSSKSVNGSSNMTWTLAEIGAAPEGHTHNYAPTSHKHGLLHDNFGVTIENTTTDNGWSMINGSYNGFLLKTLRSSANAPAWLQGDYSAGIAFGGADTKGVMSVAYNRPSIRFAGGNGSKPVWHFTVNGSSGKTYNMDSLAANTANTLATPRTINGTNFNGSANITTANWGTARNIQIGNTTKSVNGSANVSWSLSEIGAAASNHTHNYAGSSSAGGAANSANLLNITGGRAASANSAVIVGPNTSMMLSTSSMTTGKPASDGYITEYRWDNNGGWSAQLFVPNNTTGVMQYRSMNAGTWGNWNTIYSTCNPQTTITGNAGTATKLQTARTINGTNFDGTGNITTANWGTTRTLTIGKTGKSVNGSGNVSWTFDEVASGQTVNSTIYLKQDYLIHKANDAGGTNGYLHVAEIKISSAHQNQVLCITYIQRGHNQLNTVEIQFTNHNSTDPALGTILKTGNANVYIHKAATGTWNLYIQKTESYDCIDIVGFKKGAYSTGTTVTWKNTNVASLPSGYVTATLKTAVSNISGNSATATKLQTARSINGTNFDGTGNITTANWGTARNIQIGNTAKSVNGGANVSWSLSEIGAAPTSHGHSNMLTFKSNHTTDWTSSSAMSGKTYMGGWHGELTSGTTGYISLGAKGGNTLDLMIDGDIYVRENSKVYHSGNKPTASEIGAAAASHTHNYAGSSSAGGAANTAVKLATARTIALGGILSGSASFDGSGNVTINATANDITTITKSLKVTTSWMDTGITGSNLGTGTYAVQMYVNDGTNTSQYQEYYSGMMSWFNGTTNSTDADEILLHKAGHASNGRHVYLRTIRTSNSGYLKLQISCTHAFSAASSITFKFKKLI